AVSAVHFVAGALWVGVVAHVALLSGRGMVRRRAAALHRPAVALSAVVVASGLWNSRIHITRLADLTGSGYGRMLLLKAALVGAVAGLGWLAHRRLSDRQHRVGRALRAEAGVMAGVLGATAGLLFVPLPAAASAGPTLGSASAGGDVLTALDVPAGPVAGRQLVFVGMTATVTGLSLRPAGSARSYALEPLGAGRWGASVPGGTPMRNLVAHAAGRPPVTIALRPVDPAASYTGSLSADAGTADRVLARAAALSLGVRSLVAGAGEGGQQQAMRWGRLVASALARRGAKEVGVLTSLLPESEAFAAGLVAGARAAGVTVITNPPAAALTRTDALVLAGGPDQAVAALRAEQKVRSDPLGVVMAPWLLQPEVLDQGTDGGASVELASTLDPNSGVAVGYLRALASVAPGFAPSGDGLWAFASALGPDSTGTAGGLHLYAVTAVQFLPSYIEAGHNHGPGGWFSVGGQLVPIGRGP
ncbi:MAG TPA: CopD family protein, partial [Acidimicrobiales bacterium]|nr:CopD family protein [Acidimicrobiales bacterium]